MLQRYKRARRDVICYTRAATSPEYLYEFLAYRLPGSEDSHVLLTLFRWKQLWPFTSCHTSWSDAILRG